MPPPGPATPVTEFDVDGLLVGRALLLAVRVPSRILPRELGSASFFGTSALGGLAASPADLVLTALAVYAVCVALRNFAARLSVERPRLAQAIAVVGALGTAAAAWEREFEEFKQYPEWIMKRQYEDFGVEDFKFIWY